MKYVGLAVVGMALSLSACVGRNSPDEFQVIERPSLIVPPENDLKPPRPGKSQVRPIDPGRMAYEALFPGKRFPKRPEDSDTEKFVLNNLPYSNPDIRSNAGNLELKVVPKALLLAELLDMPDRVNAPDNISIDRTGSGS